MKKISVICLIVALFALCNTFKAADTFAYCGACDVDEEEAKKLAAGETTAAGALYKKHCEICHGYKGDGKTFLGRGLNARDFTDAEWEAKITDAEMIKQIGEGTPHLKPGEDKKMFGFKDKLTPEEIKMLVHYVRAFAKKK